VLGEEALRLDLDFALELGQENRFDLWWRCVFKRVDLCALSNRSLQNDGTHHHFERGSLSISWRSSQRGTAGEQKRETDSAESTGAERANWELRKVQRHFHTPFLR
jgi:hypothetical protein